MKNIFILTAMISGLFTQIDSTEARNLTYKMGAGYKQVYTNAAVQDSGVFSAQQVNGLEASYNFTTNLQVGAFFGTLANLNFMMVGPTVRYDFQDMLSGSPDAWDHINLFIQGAFLAKMGKEYKEGLLIQAPYFGAEIFPFKGNHFAIQTAAGLTIDLVKENSLGFTNGMFGDVGVKFYF